MTEGTIFLILAVGLALAFEFVNGFHDTANAVATVIYTRSLKSHVAVIYSGLLNFLGVMLAGVGVAYSIVHLLPAQALESNCLPLIFAVLGSAIIWNVATWFVGIPASSSHALIGSIVGASMAWCTRNGVSLETGVPWDKARSVVAALLFSPLLGFASAALLLYLLKRTAREELFEAPEGDQPPPGWVRALLIFGCGGVSFAHGSNDGQKGMGLIMLILMGLAPAAYCLNLDESGVAAARVCAEAAVTAPAPLRQSLLESAQVWQKPLAELPEEKRAHFRAVTLSQAQSLDELGQHEAADVLRDQVQYVAPWVKLAVALALGLGTMCGWKRIVVTVGEKIGKTKLNYAQGAVAQTVATFTILLSDKFHMPVSTTHVLSSGIAGAMHAQGSGLQGKTLRNIALAWVLTLPVCVSLAFCLFVALS